jgi:hypothetical protein
MEASLIVIPVLTRATSSFFFLDVMDMYFLFYLLRSSIDLSF